MAAVLDALAPFVKKLVQDMAQKEVSKLLGVSGEITQLGSTMEKITEWVSDAESKRITDPKVQKFVNKLKDAMYDGTDILELCQLEAEERRELEEGLLGEGGNREQNLLACFQPLQVWLQNPVVTLITCGGVAKMKAFFQSFLFCLRNPVFADEIGSRIKELNERLEGINKEAENNFKFQRYLDSSNPEPRKLTDDAESSICETGSYVDESTIVGQQIESDTRELVRVLTTDDNKNHQDLNVVSIVGTGGMGKSTLAQKIFSDATIHEHFKTKIWLSITKHFDGAELLKTAIENAGGHHGGRKDKSTLMKTLEDTLSTKGRFLLVMDDVWDNKAWEHVLQHPINIASKKQPGSRVLLTTRKEDVAEQMLAFWYQHEVRPLNEDDAWSLLKRQLHPEKVRGIDQLKSIGMEILKRCDGLPLAIKVIGGVLKTKRAIQNDWKSVLNNPAWSLSGVPQELDKRLYLSYQDLSPQLRQCFLYCSLIPKGQPIVGAIITEMWISEGFIQPQDGTISVSHGLQEEEIEYYQQLIKRNLIEPLPDYSYTLYRCTMHDVIRSFAEYMAREESLVVVGREKQAANPGMHVRRLSMKQTEEWKILQRQESLRTLMMINSNLPADSLASFSSLRILHILYYDDCDTLVTSLSKLKHLRYLHLEATDISRLPDDIHNMKFLQHIHLLLCEKLCYLPDSIIKLKHLRSLYLSGSNVSVVPKGFAGLTNLISLVGFPVHLDNSWCSLQELAPLSLLRNLGLCGLGRMNDSHMVEMGMLSRMGHLKLLELQYGASGDMMPQSVAEEVLEKLCPPTCIETIEFMGGYAGWQLPNWMHAPKSEDFKSLLSLTLENLPFCTQLPDGLCCLPSLKVLVIRDAPSIKSIGREFQASSSSAAFPNLVLLELVGLSACEKWEWDHCDEATIAMPCLEKLIINNCSRLRCLPPGLASEKRHALRQLQLYQLTNLTHVEDFPSVVELHVYCPKLKRISRFRRLHKILIDRCTNLEVLEGVPELNRLELRDATMDTLPGYLRAVSPCFLDLHCNMKLYEFLTKDGCSEYNKIGNHIKNTKITGYTG